MRWRIAVFVCLLGSSANAAQPDDAVHYTLSPVMRAGQLEALSVEMRFRADASGTTQLDLPDHWAGEKELWRQVHDLVISGANAVNKSEPGKRIIQSEPGAEIVVQYAVAQATPGEPEPNGGTYMLTVQPGYFHVIGHALFALPEGPMTRPATFLLRDLPAGWNFASTLTGRTLTVDDTDSSISVGGDFRVIAPAAFGDNVHIAIRGAWDFADAEFVDAASRVLDAEWKYWGEEPSPFTVTVLPLAGAQYISLGGSGMNAGFGFFATRNVAMPDIIQTLAHEKMHTWIPLAIGGNPETEEARAYWLSEGFTDYFSRRVLLASGIWKLDDYVRVLNKTLYDYGTSPGRTVPNTEIVKNFWNSDDVQQLPYRRGFLLATIWNAKVHGGLDTVIHDMRDRARTKAANETAIDIFPIVMRAHGYDANDDIARFVERGEMVRLPENVFPACGKVVTESLPAFSRGFDAEATAKANHVIAGVDPDGPAYAAGLRNGMTLVKRVSPPVNDARLPISYEVSDNGVTRTITWLPAGKERFDVQQLHLTPGLSGEAEQKCVAEIAGR